MSLPSLFLKEIVQGDTSRTKLPQDMDLWAESIDANLKEKLPEAKDMLIKISFTQKNEELGTATGSAIIHNQKLNKAVYVPLIVKNFNLYPMDVILVPKKTIEKEYEVVPFTREYFMEAMFNNQLFDHLERPMDRIQQLYMNPQNNASHPPQYRNVHASAQIIDSISDTISPEDRDAFLEQLKDSPEILVGYEKRANLDVLKKIAAAKLRVSGKATARIKGIALLKAKSGNVMSISTSDEVFDPILADDFEGPLQDIPEETLNEVKQNGEKIVTDKLAPTNDVMLGPSQSPQHYTKGSEKSVDTKVFGAYKVQDKNGVFHTGVVIPTIINFDMRSVSARVFYSLNKSSYQSKISGIPTNKEPLQFLKYKTPAEGMTGVFITHNDKHALSTIPITIKSVYEKHGTKNIVALDINGRGVKIKFGSCGDLPNSNNEAPFEEKQELQQIAKVKDYYIVPNRFKFLPLDNFCDLMENGQKSLEKAASFRMDNNPVTLIHTGHSQFSLRGPDMEKMASMVGWNTTNLSPGQVAFILGAKKCPMSKVASAMRMAGSAFGQTYIHGLPKTKYSIEKKASFDPRSLRVNLIKEASHLEESQVVDAALSLNFINSDNVNKFQNFIPLFEEAIKGLAQSLLASRLGMHEIPEQSTASAMYKMIEVVSGLKRLTSISEDK